MEPTAAKKSRRCTDELLHARREEILDTATQLFAEYGYSDAITQVLADKVQVGKGTIYRYFPSKRDLFLAAADRVMRRAREWVEVRIAGVEDGLERVARGVAAFLDFFARHPEFVELLVQERAQFKDRTRPTYFEHREKNIERWKEIYRSLIAEGRVRGVPVERITDVVSNLIYGTIFTNYFAGQQKPSEQQAQDILDVVFFGILSEPERRRRLGC